MNKEVYKHILQTYGRRPMMWVGYFFELVKSLLIRVYLVIIMTQAIVSLAEGDIQNAKIKIFHYFVAHLIGTISGTIAELIFIRSENATYEKIAIDFYLKLSGKDMSFYRDNQTGYLASIFRQYADGTIQLVRSLRGKLTAVAISLSVPVIILFKADWRVGSLAGAVVALQLFYIYWSSSKANKYRAMAHEAYRKVSGEVSDVITNIVTYKSGGLERETNTQIMRLVKEETHSFWLRRKATALLDLPRGIITGVGVSVVFYFVLRSSAQGAAALGLMVMTMTYMFQIIRNIFELPSIIIEHDDWITRIQPVLRYLGNDFESIKDPAEPKVLKISDASIDIDHVNFSYKSKTGQAISIFSDLNLHIRGGEQVGIIGLSGAGKSTLASLLMRFDDIDSGAIKIDGTDIREVRQSDLRRAIAYVPQEPLLFHRTIKDNIKYFDPNATDDAMESAAAAAHAQEFIENLPQQYDTIVGERGVKLSGGQKQRVVIARSILKGAHIVIFDEATSALDSESEQIIQRALPQIIGKKTAIVIAHRLSTVAGLDRIVVMENGKIVEEGTHEKLLDLQGRYYSLWQKQTQML